MIVIPEPFVLEDIDRTQVRQLAMADAPADRGAPSSRNSTPACPVDHASRETLLQQAAHAARSGDTGSMASQPPSQSRFQKSDPRSWTQTISSYMPSLWSSPPAATSGPATTPPATADTRPPGRGGPRPLETSRVVSSIPRSSSPGESACPDNHEQETGADKTSGHWVYPSEKMFFDAMRRKGHDARTADMRTVVPIHNAVNERAWHEIQGWERPWLERSKCGGPRLHSFAGKNDSMTPKARLNTLLGFAAPFDRHDWVIDRCGTRVDYVIDFYAGRPVEGGRPGPSFYLDVRPKLNTWEGVKMRALRVTGLA